MTSIILLGILICLMFSALFSGLTLGSFGVSRLKLEIESEAGNTCAKRLLVLRKDSNLLLTTLLWSNVSVNTLLALLSESILTGLTAFLFSTFGITLLGEILPQAYFSRRGIKAVARLAPLVHFFQILLYPVAKPSAKLLDLWLGKEGITLFRESELKIMLEKHMKEQKSDISLLEGTGALNFLSLDDLKICEEGEIIDPKSIISGLPVKNHLPEIPPIERDASDPFLQKVHESRKKWVILTYPSGQPALVMNADAFLRDALYAKTTLKPYSYCHRPIVVDSPEVNLGQVLLKLKVYPEHAEDDVIDQDLILYWNASRRIITGADLLGRLLRGIVIRQMKKEDEFKS